MKLLQKKGAKKVERFAVKIPVELSQRIEELNEKIKTAGYQIDWSEPVVEALQKAVSIAEAELKDAEKAA